MKEHNEIDKLFEESLGNLQGEPSADSWETLATSLDASANVVQGNRKRRFFIYAFIGTVAALLTYVFFFNKNHSQNIDLKKIQQVEVPTNSDKNKAIATAQIDGIQDNQSNSVELNYSEANNDVSKISPQVNSQPISSKSNTTKSELNTVNKNIETSSSQAVSKAVVKNTAVSNAKPIQTQAILVPASTPSNANKMQTKNAVYSHDIDSSLDVSNTQQQLVVTKEASASQGIQAKKVVENSEADESSSNAPSPGGITGIHNSTGWSLGVFGGPAYINSNETFVVEEGQLLYQTEKEQKIITPNLSININYHYNNWFIRSGIGYAEYGENRSYSNKIEMHDTSGYATQSINNYYTYDTTGWIKDPGNSNVLIPVYDAILHSDTVHSWVSQDSLYYEHQSIYAQNRFRYIEIPLMLGYEFRYKNLGLELATGVSVGFRVNSSGKFMDSNNELVNINSSNSPYSNTMMNYIITIGINYHIGNRLSITAQPIYKTNLNSIIKSGVGSDIRYNNLGVNLGINYIIK
ncbi:MAG: hypothetical protein KAG64_01735 [Bacteroidales bacterium]|nr:hypothetical protein [Bacteroidales bacterium]